MLTAYKRSTITRIVSLRKNLIELYIISMFSLINLDMKYISFIRSLIEELIEFFQFNHYLLRKIELNDQTYLFLTLSSRILNETTFLKGPLVQRYYAMKKV